MKVVLLAALLAIAATKPGLDNARIETLTGAKGKLDEKEHVFKVSVPRSDLSVTALHNHFLWDSPKVMFMHVGGMGDEATLATAIGRVFARIEEMKGATAAAPAAIDPAKTTLDPRRVEAILPAKGELKDGVYKVTIGRKAKMHGHTVGGTMGVNTWAAFAGADDRAIVDGDFAMLETELQAVLRALRGAGMNVVAIHNHMTEEQPRMMFLHYWGVGDTESLARGLKAALDKTDHR